MWYHIAAGEFKMTTAETSTDLFKAPKMTVTCQDKCENNP